MQAHEAIKDAQAMAAKQRGLGKDNGDGCSETGARASRVNHEIDSTAVVTEQGELGQLPQSRRGRGSARGGGERASAKRRRTEAI